MIKEKLILQIKNESDEQKQIKLIKELLINTDYLKEHSALYLYEEETQRKENNFLKKYILYKKDLITEYSGLDADVSLLCITLYVLMSDNKLTIQDIFLQENTKKKYYIEKNNTFKGDTLTSALFLFKRYLGSLWKTIFLNDDMKTNERYSKFFSLFEKRARNGNLYVPNNKDFLVYCLENIDIIWKAMDQEVKDFFECYMMLGNYIRIPAKTHSIDGHTYFSFNTSRSNIGKWDCIDLLLVKIYLYYHSNKNIEYLKQLFTSCKEKLAEETAQWLQEFPNWKCFLLGNCLMAAVDKESLIPISLKTGKPVLENQMENYKHLPKTHTEYLSLFSQLTSIIKERNIDMYLKIRNN